MDSDQTDAAADLAAAATYAGGGGCASGEESWARALLRRGWDLSWKVAIAGVAVTAAPVIAPPIIILSVAGVALSVPFAACLASVAATDRLMGALLPTAAPQPYYTYDLRDEESEQEFMDASGTPDQEATGVLGYWSKPEEDTIIEQNEGFASLSLSREPSLPEELVPLLANEEDDSAEGEFASQKSGHELFVPKDGKRKDNDIAIKVDNEYIIMEAPPPGIVSMPEVQVFREKENMVRIAEDASVPAMESVQELSVLDNHNKTEDGKSSITLENESSKEILLPGLYTTESSDLTLPQLGDDDVLVQRYVGGHVSVSKSGKNSHVSDSGGKTEQHKTTEVMPLYEVNVSESPVPDDNMVPNKSEDELAVEMVPQELMRDTNPVTGEGVDVQLDVISTAAPKSESLQSRYRVALELQAMTESANVHGTPGSNLTEGIVKDADNKITEGVEHYGEKDVPYMVIVDDDKDLNPCRSRLNVTAISDGITGVGSKPHADHPNQTTCVFIREHGEEKLAEDKCVKTKDSKTMDDRVPTTDMEAQDDHISKSHGSMREDEAIVEMVLEEVTSSIDPVTEEVVEVEVDILARGSKLLPLSDLVAHELQALTGAGMVGDKTEDIVKGIGDTNVVDVKRQSGEGASSFVSVTSVLALADGEDLMSSRSTPYASAISDAMMSVEGWPDLGHHHQTTGAEYKVMDREFKTKVLAEDKKDKLRGLPTTDYNNKILSNRNRQNKEIYTEEQLREQLNTLRTITGYRAVPSLTLEGELDGLYILVGVESSRSSGGASNLTELNRRLRFLKSIIGVE